MSYSMSSVSRIRALALYWRVYMQRLSVQNACFVIGCSYRALELMRVNSTCHGTMNTTTARAHARKYHWLRESIQAKCVSAFLCSFPWKWVFFFCFSSLFVWFIGIKVTVAFIGPIPNKDLYFIQLFSCRTTTKIHTHTHTCTCTPEFSKE